MEEKKKKEEREMEKPQRIPSKVWHKATLAMVNLEYLPFSKTQLAVSWLLIFLLKIL